MASYEKAILTALCMVYDGNKILMQNRVKEDWKGLTFPGGHIEKGESFVSGIIREIKEETGLTICNPQLCGIKQFPTKNDERYIVLLFSANQFYGNLCSSEEGEMIWVDRDDLNKITVADGFFDVLKIYDENFAELFYVHNQAENKWIAEVL